MQVAHDEVDPVAVIARVLYHCEAQPLVARPLFQSKSRGKSDANASAANQSYRTKFPASLVVSEGAVERETFKLATVHDARHGKSPPDQQLTSRVYDRQSDGSTSNSAPSRYFPPSTIFAIVASCMLLVPS